MTPRLFFSGHLSLGHASSDCRPFWGGQIAAFDMESGLTTADYGWGTKNFRQLGLRKTELVVQLLRFALGASSYNKHKDLLACEPQPW